MGPTQEDFESMTLLAQGDYDENARTVPTKLSQKSSANTLSTYLSAGLILFFLLDIVLFAWISRLLLRATSTLVEPDSLEFRNPYVGLADLYKYHPEIKPTKYGKIVNEPQLATQVSSMDPYKVFPVDLHRWMSDYGVLSPPDRRLQVSKDIYTINQFNILDWGMEKCTIGIRLPSPSDALPHPFVLPKSSSTLSLSICQLDAARPFKESTLTWSNKPACLKTKTFTAEAKVGGEIELEPFECKSGAYFAFLVGCAEGKGKKDCNVDVWTNHNQTWGMFLNQYQTV